MKAIGLFEPLYGNTVRIAACLAKEMGLHYDEI